MAEGWGHSDVLIKINMQTRYTTQLVFIERHFPGIALDADEPRRTGTGTAGSRLRSEPAGGPSIKNRTPLLHSTPRDGARRPQGQAGVRFSLYTI